MLYGQAEPYPVLDDRVLLRALLAQLGDLEPRKRRASSSEPSDHVNLSSPAFAHREQNLSSLHVFDFGGVLGQNLSSLCCLTFWGGEGGPKASGRNAVCLRGFGVSGLKAFESPRSGGKGCQSPPAPARPPRPSL